MILLQKPTNDVFKYHSECHQQIIRAKDYTPVKRDIVLDLENDQNFQNDQENVDNSENEGLADDNEESDYNDDNDPEYIPDDDDVDDIEDRTIADVHPDYLPDPNNPTKCRYLSKLSYTNICGKYLFLNK